MTEPMFSFTINREEWGWGRAGADAAFYNSTTDKSCALGHYFLALGYKPSQLEVYGDPVDAIFDRLYESRGEVPISDLESWLLSDDEPSDAVTSVLGEVIISINDNEDLERATIEIQLIEAFAEAGVALAFEGKVRDE